MSRLYTVGYGLSTMDYLTITDKNYICGRNQILFPMRLGQLARKLAVRPTEIAEFLSKENIQLEANSNTRIEDDLVIHLVKHFAPDMVEAIKAELTKEEIAIIEEEKTEVTPEIQASAPVAESLPEPEVISVQPEETVVSRIEPAEPVIVEETNTAIADEEVIRAPKIELPGLKVLGKIEIPEPKKKEAEPAAEVPSDSAVKKDVAPEKEITRSRERRQPQERRKEFRRNDEQRNRRNPIAVQREREAEEARQKKEEAAKLEKERRTLHYMKKVKVVTPVKVNTFIDEPAETKAVREETPTSLWGRFKKWLKS